MKTLADIILANLFLQSWRGAEFEEELNVASHNSVFLHFYALILKLACLTAEDLRRRKQWGLAAFDEDGVMG
ncbi:hypothetical protein LOK49_LG09G00001 [Camellia lanceoleosa]|uniref:Uncharacterized protein n=1 Tax=Camellia lanceoleosa TaxID=1840588 RepID=A0ACC0GE79_9ERIC|nr:hypothetical protein LOK49_LG09G00001 [Camellia lanceoleosa]